ncbi:FHA domain-containing protein [Lysinibacter sp. HNR]|uniref:FHA domain-containing protein n=1 Tax=Lysinibacter sp. HNR TaxID=3031408 RepID=UPI002435EAF2|nr:FHA domain-containing protein [Lysinibacter sp. HNR]WGD36487.1 FHA domain-containing protein [Lysinibacter sp. HNR]
MNESPDKGTDSTARFNSELSSLVDALNAELSAEEQEAVKALPSGSALLIVRRGPDTGARFLLASDSTVAGRHPEVNIFLDDVTVSRRHAVFTREGISFSVTDLNSLNGTFCNGVRISEPTLLKDSSEVQIGKFKLTFYPSRHDLVRESEGK